MKRTQHTALTLALGSALATTLAVAPVAAAENPFASRTMDKGYMVASAEGKCGGMKEAEGKKAEGKKAEGKCGGKKADKGADKSADKAKEGKCGGMKEAEGKCGGKK